MTILFEYIAEEDLVKVDITIGVAKANCGNIIDGVLN